VQEQRRDETALQELDKFIRDMPSEIVARDREIAKSVVPALPAPA
jgi:hypothetical protein